MPRRELSAEHARGEAFLGKASSLGPQLPQRPSVSARSFRFSCRLLFGTVVDKKKKLWNTHCADIVRAADGHAQVFVDDLNVNK